MRQRHTVKYTRILLGLLAVWGAMLTGCSSGGKGLPAGTNTATLHATWKTGWDISSDTHIFINGAEVGQVARGNSKSMQFIPKTGSNTIELPYEFTGTKCAWTGEFKIKPQEVFSITFAPLTNGSFAIYSRSDTDTESNPTPVNLQLGTTTQKVYVGEEVVTSVQGVDLPISKSHTIDQSVDFSAATTLGVTAGLNLGVLTTSVTAQVEQRKGIQLRTSQTISKGATISGAVGGRKYKLIWYDLVRDGTVEVPTAFGTKTLPFRYKEDAILEVIPE